LLYTAGWRGKIIKNFARPLILKKPPPPPHAGGGFSPHQFSTARVRPPHKAPPNF